MTNPTKREYPALPEASWAMSPAMIALLHVYADPLLDEIERLKDSNSDWVETVRRNVLDQNEYLAEIKELRATIERQRESLEAKQYLLVAAIGSITDLQAELEKKE